MENNKYVCAECQSEEVQIRSWTNANTGQWISDCSEGDIEDNWCEICEKHVHFKIIEQ
jgi:hypothetical protein